MHRKIIVSVSSVSRSDRARPLALGLKGISRSMSETAAAGGVHVQPGGVKYVHPIGLDWKARKASFVVLDARISSDLSIASL